MTEPARVRLQVTVLSTPSTARAASGLGPWLTQVAPLAARGIVTIAMVSDGRMRRLNATFRSVNHATDVLSFPDLGQDVAPRMSRKVLQNRDLGEIAIASGVAAKQADAHGHSLRTELRLLALHGLLHLLGYDHERDRGAMRRLEERLRRRAGLPSGVIARVPARHRSP